MGAERAPSASFIFIFIATTRRSLTRTHYYVHVESSSAEVARGINTQCVYVFFLLFEPATDSRALML